MLFLSVFTEILMSYGPSVRSWTLETGTPTDPTGSPEHRKNHLDVVQAGSGAVTHQGDICRATTRPPHSSSTAECLCLIAHPKKGTGIYGLLKTSATV